MSEDIRVVYERCGENLERHLTTILEEYGPQGALQVIVRASQVARHRWDENKAGDYIGSLFGLGHQIASASGGFLGMGNRISKAEKHR